MDWKHRKGKPKEITLQMSGLARLRVRADITEMENLEGTVNARSMMSGGIRTSSSTP